MPINFNSLSIEGVETVLESVYFTLCRGLSLFDIQNLIRLILLIRFIILLFRYGIKTAFLITCIGIMAGYLWYRRFVAIAIRYRTALLFIPYGEKLGASVIELKFLLGKEAEYNRILGRGSEAQWYQPGQILIYAINNAILALKDKEVYYIDPISMLVSKLPESYRLKIEPFYYLLYQHIIPNVYYGLRYFWRQSQTLCMYVVITRMGRKFCPYLVRWHWTFLIILNCVEAPLSSFLKRVENYQQLVLIPLIEELSENENHVVSGQLLKEVILENEFLNLFVQMIIVAHLGFLMFGLLHAFCGQYFYFPLFVESTEGHVGKRPIQSVYSGGQTAWQNEGKPGKLKKKLWYGWFGHGSNENKVKKILKKIKKYFRNKRKKK